MWGEDGRTRRNWGDRRAKFFVALYVSSSVFGLITGGRCLVWLRKIYEGKRWKMRAGIREKKGERKTIYGSGPGDTVLEMQMYETSIVSMPLSSTFLVLIVADLLGPRCHPLFAQSPPGSRMKSLGWSTRSAFESLCPTSFLQAPDSLVISGIR